MKHLPFVVFLAAAALPASAQDITGTATVYDADKIMIDGERILVWGIDSFDGDQRCRLEGQAWDCRGIALRALEILVDQASVTCRRVDEIEVFGRIWGKCEANGKDLGEEMVRSGMAFAYRPQTDQYIVAEDAARAEGAGLWQSEFIFPWDWRERFDRGEENR